MGEKGPGMYIQQLSKLYYSGTLIEISMADV